MVKGRRAPFAHERREAGYVGLLIAVVELAQRDAVMSGPQMGEMGEMERRALQFCAQEFLRWCREEFR